MRGTCVYSCRWPDFFRTQLPVSTIPCSRSIRVKLLPVAGRADHRVPSNSPRLPREEMNHISDGLFSFARPLCPVEVKGGGDPREKVGNEVRRTGGKGQESKNSPRLPREEMNHISDGLFSFARPLCPVEPSYTHSSRFADELNVPFCATSPPVTVSAGGGEAEADGGEAGAGGGEAGAGGGEVEADGGEVGATGGEVGADGGEVGAGGGEVEADGGEAEADCGEAGAKVVASVTATVLGVISRTSGCRVAGGALSDVKSDVESASSAATVVVAAVVEADCERHPNFLLFRPVRLLEPR
ncbi:hypothetical protein MTO96_014144 [Rhipicephalus appendiculatus]